MQTIILKVNNNNDISLLIRLAERLGVRCGHRVATSSATVRAPLTMCMQFGLFNYLSI